jgi:hypothetical protein
VLQAFVAGTVYLAVDRWGTRRLHTDVRVGPVAAGWLVYVALLCGAALLAIAYDQGPWTAVVAASPLLLTRFSFQRYSLARRTYDQTIQALAIVPELAGHASIGHGERTGAYAELIADEMRLDGTAARRLTIASRLHHIGHLSLPDMDADGVGAPNFAEVSWLGGGILRETKFLAEVAELLEAGALADLGQRPARHLAIETAVLQVASDFDDYVGDDPARVDDALALVAGHHTDPDAAAAIAALGRVVAARPDTVAAAIRRGERLTSAAASAASGYPLFG